MDTHKSAVNKEIDRERDKRTHKDLENRDERKKVTLKIERRPFKFEYIN